MNALHLTYSVAVRFDNLIGFSQSCEGKGSGNFVTNEVDVSDMEALNMQPEFQSAMIGHFLAKRSSGINNTYLPLTKSDNYNNKYDIAHLGNTMNAELTIL